MGSKVADNDSFFLEDEWEDSIRLAKEMDGAEPDEDDDFRIAANDDWDALSPAVDVPSTRDETYNGLELSPTQLAAQAQAARDAVKMFEAERLQSRRSKETIRQKWADEIVLGDNLEEPSDEDLAEIDMDDEDLTDLFDDFESLEDLQIFARNNARQEIDENRLEMIDDSYDDGMPDFSDMTVANLKNELKKRELKSMGTKKQLTAALRESYQQGTQGTEAVNNNLNADFQQAAQDGMDPSQSSSKRDSKESPESNVVDALPDFETMTVAELKEELIARGVKVGGKKAELIGRLLGALVLGSKCAQKSCF